MNTDHFSRKKLAVEGKRARAGGAGGWCQWRPCFFNGEGNLNLKKLMRKTRLTERAKHTREKVSEQDWVLRRWKGMQRSKNWLQAGEELIPIKEKEKLDTLFCFDISEFFIEGKKEA